VRETFGFTEDFPPAFARSGKSVQIGSSGGTKYPTQEEQCPAASADFRQTEGKTPLFRRTCPRLRAPGFNPTE
jgi:hypothetical protein